MLLAALSSMKAHEHPHHRDPSHDARPPGRDFDDPRKPLGAEFLDHSAPESVADRTKAVAILRKAEEFMRTNNPPATDMAGARRALELAAGRMGLKIGEYDAIVREDPELQALEQRVLEDDLNAPTRSEEGLPDQVKARTS
jgi:hypothetical protein